MRELLVVLIPLRMELTFVHSAWLVQPYGLVFETADGEFEFTRVVGIVYNAKSIFLDTFPRLSKDLTH